MKVTGRALSVLALSCAIAGSAAGCAGPAGRGSSGSASRNPVAGPSGYPTATASRLTAEVTFPDGTKFAVPTAGQTPAVSASAAYASCAVDGVCSTDSPPTIELADVVIPLGGTGHDAATSAAGQLAYVLHWPAAPCAPAGPVATAGPWTCSLYDIVDARNGKTIYSFQDEN